MAATKSEKVKVHKRRITIKGRDGWVALDVTAELRSSGLLPGKLFLESRRFAQLLNAAVIEMGYNPLDVKISEASAR